MSYIQGEDREQIALFPEAIDDYITEDKKTFIISSFSFSGTLEFMRFAIYSKRNS